MSRSRKQAYRTGELSDLTRQLLYTPPDKRAEVIRHAEQLHDELEDQKNYPIDFVVYRLTDRRVPPSESVLLVGEAIKPDLRLLIDALSRSIALPCEDDDPGMTTSELADSLGVSTKTIGRWRDAGLRWRWGVREAEAKPMVLITRSAVDAFEARQSGRVSAAAAFTRLSDTEKHRLLERARRLAWSTDELPQTILSHLSKRSGRSIEALRQLIHRHDEQHPDSAVFADHTGPLTNEQKHTIDEAYRQGATVSALCQQFGKTRSTIYRAIHEGRACRIATLAITAVHSPTFDRADADEVLMHPIVRQGEVRHLGPEVVASLPDSLKPIYDRPIEPDDVVRSLIVRYNFLKYRAIALQKSLAQGPPKASDLDQFDGLLGRIAKARGEVMAAALPVALSVVRRQQTATEQGQAPPLVAMLSAAHRVLIEEIDRYDAAVAHTFESVLTNRLLRVLASPGADVEACSEGGLVEQLHQAGFAIHG